VIASPAPVRARDDRQDRRGVRAECDTEIASASGGSGHACGQLVRCQRSQRRGARVVRALAQKPLGLTLRERWRKHALDQGAGRHVDADREHLPVAAAGSREHGDDHLRALVDVRGGRVH
jgi:hypothetical protein